MERRHIKKYVPLFLQKYLTLFDSPLVYIHYNIYCIKFVEHEYFEYYTSVETENQHKRLWKDDIDAN